MAILKVTFNSDRRLAIVTSSCALTIVCLLFLLIIHYYAYVSKQFVLVLYVFTLLTCCTRCVLHVLLVKKIVVPMFFIGL